MRNDTKLPELVSVPSATPVCSALYTSLLGIETIEAPAACHIDAKVGPAERNFRPFTSAGVRTQPLLEAMAPPSPAAERTTTPPPSTSPFTPSSTSYPLIPPPPP